MKRKFTFLIAAAFMLLTMMATTGTMWGQTRTTQTASYGFESGDADWTTTGFNSASGTTNLPTHEGAKYGETTNNSHTANSCNVKYNSIIANPQSISCWYTKKSSNTNSSSKFVIQTSTDGSTWTTRATGNTMNNVTSGTWYELTADLSSYNDIYVRVAYEGTSAIRILDDITLTYDDGQSPSTDPVISFSPASVTLDYVLVNNQASTTFTVSQSNLEEGISLSVDNGELSQNSIDKDADPTSISWTYTPTTAGAISATVTATSGETSQTLEISGTAIAPVESYDVDFEYATNMYPNWTFDNMTTYQTGSITAHGGTYYGTTGGKTTASLTTTEKVENPGTLTCYVSKASNNNTSSTWYIQVSTDGTSWTEVKSQDATSMSKGTWVEFTADLSNYSNVYARIYYEGSTAVRTIDDLTLTTAAPSNIFTVTYDANGATAGTVPVDETQYDSDNNTVSVLGNTGNLAKAGYIWAGWCMNAEGTGTVYGPDYTTTFEISGNTTLYAKWDAKTITSLAYTGTPTTTTYTAGQSFDPTGLIVTATFNDASQEDVTSQVEWTPDPLTTGTTSVTGTYMGQTINISGLTVTAAPGSADNPYTVAQAIAATPASGTSANVYIHGIVSSFYNTSIVGDGSNYRYRISDDGTTTTQLLVYKGKGLNQETFTDANDLLVGDEVVIYGTLNIYNNAPQIASGNYLYSWVRPIQDVATPTFSVAAGTYASAQDVEISCETEGATIYYTLDGTEPTNESTPYNGALNIETTTTVKAIAYKNTANSYVATATYHICSAENPYSVAQALAFLEYPANGIYVSGIVSTAPTAAPNNGQLTYYISDNGEAENELEVYKGKNLEQADFTAQDDIQVGDIVTVFGNVVIYGTSNPIKEFASGNYLTSFERPTPPVEPSITVNPTLVEATAAETEGSLTVTYTAIETNLGVEIHWFETSTSTEPLSAAPEWIDADFSTTSIETIDYFIEANASEARTAYFKVYGLDTNGDDVYSDLVTVSQEEYVAPTTASITVDPALVEATAEGGDGTLTVTYTNITEINADVYFCNENGDAATYDWIEAEIDDNNNVYYVIGANEGEARTAYFKVYALDDNAEDVYSNLVTISQEEGTTPPTPGQYEWVATDLANLTADDVFVIVGDNGETYAMSNDNGTSSAPAAVEVTVEDEKLSGNIAENIQWNLSTSDDGYTFYPNGSTETWLYCTNTNNGVRVGTNTAKVFVIDGGYLKHVGTSRYVGIYNSSDWRCYTSYTTDNIKNQTFAFYKRVPVSTEPSITLSSYTITDVPAKPTTPSTTITETLTVTIANIENFDSNNLGADYCNADGSAISPKPDFIGFEFEENPSATDSYILTCTFGENNDPEARTAYFKVTYNEDEVVSQVVTATQLGYVAPTASITLDEYAINATADETQGSLTVILENMTISDVEQFSIDFFHQDGSDFEQGEEKPDWVTAEFTLIENVYSMNYTVGANTETTERNAYFKVYGLDDDGETEAYSDLVTVTQAAYVPPVVTDDYELFSGELVEGDYIIYYNGKAMMDSVVSNRLYYKEVNPSNNVISTGDASIVWHIAPNGDYWTIYSADAVAYAASTNSKNQATLYQGTPDSYDNALWTASGTETYEFENKARAAASTDSDKKWLRNNGNYGFACYATGTGGALSLFKKVDNTPTISFNGPSANIGTYAVGEEITWGNIIVSQHNLTDSISLSADKGTVTPTSIDAGADPTEVVWSYTPTTAGYTVDTITATSGTVEATFLIQFVAKTPHSIDTVAEHGIIVVLGDKTTAIENENVDFTVTPDEGYELNEITVMAEETPVDYIQGETFYRFQMPDSDVTISATFTALPTYTVSFSVNGTVDSELTETVTTGSSIEDLPTESTLTPDGFTIYGWAEANSTEAVAEPYEPTGDVILYALLQLENAPATTENYVKVTEELTDWSGEYLIVYEDGEVAFDGRLESLDVASNTIAVTITNNTIVATATTDDSKFTIAALSEGGYSIQSASGYYIGQTSDANGLASSTETVYANTLSYDTENECVNVISSGGPYMRYNSNSGQNRFRYFKSSTYTGQQAIQLYKKTSGAAIPTIINVAYVSDTTSMSTDIPESTCYVVEDGAVLTFTGTNEGTAANLVVQEGGQLIHENAVNATIQKGIDGYSSKSGSGWYFIASPADGVSTSGLITDPVTSYDLYKYDEPSGWWYSNHGEASPFNTLERGKGYLYANANDIDLDFAGLMIGTDDEVTKTLSFACTEYPELKGYNLMGNPFTRNLGSGDITLGDEPVTSVLLLNNDSEYQTCNFEKGGVIKPGQGFFIQATDGDKLELKFNPSSTKDANEIGLISIEAGNENYIDKAYIQFDGGNTLRKMTLTGDKSQVYVMHHYEDYAAARLYSTTGSVPVNFEAAYEGIFTITIETKNLDLETLRLIDNMTGDEIDLLAESSYTFKANSDEPAERFTLLFEKSILGIDENAENEVFAYQFDDEILVSGEGTLQVFDVMGRYVASYEVNGSKRISTSLFNAGVYIFKMNGEKNMTQKIVVR